MFYPKVLLIILEEVALLKEIKLLRGGAPSQDNLKFKEIMRDLEARQQEGSPNLEDDE